MVSCGGLQWNYRKVVLFNIIIAMETRPAEKLVMLSASLCQKEFWIAKNEMWSYAEEFEPILLELSN